MTTEATLDAKWRELSEAGDDTAFCLHAKLRRLDREIAETLAELRDLARLEIANERERASEIPSSD